MGSHFSTVSHPQIALQYVEYVVMSKSYRDAIMICGTLYWIGVSNVNPPSWSIECHVLRLRYPGACIGEVHRRVTFLWFFWNYIGLCLSRSLSCTRHCDPDHEEFNPYVWELHIHSGETVSPAEANVPKRYTVFARQDAVPYG